MEFLESFSGDSFCVLRKTWEGSEVMLVFHTGEESETIDLGGITVNGKEISEENIRGTLETGEEKVSVSGTAVTMPEYSVLVLK